MLLQYLLGAVCDELGEQQTLLDEGKTLAELLHHLSIPYSWLPQSSFSIVYHNSHEYRLLIIPLKLSLTD